MNEDMKLKNDYKETFTGIHAPEALSRKVRNMSRLETKKVGLPMMKKVALAAAVAGVLFVGSNGVAYAATGSTWVETVVIHFNGSGYDAELNGEVGDDAVTYEVTEGQEVMDGIVIDLTEESWITEEYNVTE